MAKLGDSPAGGCATSIRSVRRSTDDDGQERDRRENVRQKATRKRPTAAPTTFRPDSVSPEDRVLYQ